MLLNLVKNKSHNLFFFSHCVIYSEYSHFIEYRADCNEHASLCPQGLVCLDLDVNFYVEIQNEIKFG